MTDIPAWLNYHHLQCFVAVVEEGGLVPAARRLGVSHPTVSEQLKKLEANLGLPLFQRQGRRLQLTENGGMVYGYAEQIFGIGSSLLEAVEGRRSGRSVLARVGVDSVLAKLAVRRAVSPMLDALGEALRLRCVEDDRERLIALLRGRQLDVVLSDAPAHVSGAELSSRMISRSGLAFFGAGPLAELARDFPRSLDNAPFLLPMTTTRLRRELERWLGARRLRPRVVAEIEDSGLLKAFGQEGHGVFVMPDALREEVSRQYEVEIIGRVDEIETSVYAITGPDGATNPAVEALLEAAA